MEIVLHSGVENPSSLKQITVHITKKEVLDLLKYLLFSKTTLTELFLTKNFRPLPLIERPAFSPCDVKCAEEIANIQIRLKLAIIKSNGNVIYAHGGKDFMDLLLSFLTFPLGAVIQLLGAKSDLGGLDSFYTSIADLPLNSLLSETVHKDKLTHPQIAHHLQLTGQTILKSHCPEYRCYHLLNSLTESLTTGKFYVTEDVTEEHVSQDAIGYVEMSLEDHGFGQGYVKGEPALTYMVMDDLRIYPVTHLTAVPIISNLGISFHDIETKEVTIGTLECLDLLKASMTSTSCLTNGFSNLLAEANKRQRTQQ